jgi:S1-C subfamily serine protease
MLSDEIRRRVELATVQLSALGGQGVLVEGGVVLTAAHCLGWDGTGAMVLGDDFIVEMTTREGHIVKAGIAAVEPVADIAVLSALDGQRFFDESDAFEAWAEAVGGLRVATDEYPLFEHVVVSVLSHTGAWLTGTVMLCDEYAASLAVEARVEGGTSGGPIVDAAGRLVGVVSVAGDTPDGAVQTGSCPRPHMALPVWVCRNLLNLPPSA